MINKILTTLGLRDKDKFLSIDDVFYMARMQKDTYKPNSNKVNVCIGGILILYGGITFILPTGSIMAILLGLFLISCPISIKCLLKGVYNDLKFYIGVRL